MHLRMPLAMPVSACLDLSRRRRPNRAYIASRRELIWFAERESKKVLLHRNADPDEDTGRHDSQTHTEAGAEKAEII